MFLSLLIESRLTILKRAREALLQNRHLCGKWNVKRFKTNSNLFVILVKDIAVLKIFPKKIEYATLNKFCFKPKSARKFAT